MWTILAHTEEANGTVGDGGNKHKRGHASSVLQSKNLGHLKPCSKNVVTGRENREASITAGQDNPRRQT